MMSISPTPAPITTVATPAQPVSRQEQGGGVQGAIGNLIRSGSAGYATASAAMAVQSDKAAIHPFETVMTLTGFLKEKTAGIKGLAKATSLLNTIAGFGMLIGSATVSGTLRAPGQTAQDLGNRVADLIDGRKTAGPPSLGWGVRLDAATGEPTLTDAGAGSTLAALGMK